MRGDRGGGRKSSQEIKTYDIHVATIIKHKANFSQHFFFCIFIFLFYDTKVAENSKYGLRVGNLYGKMEIYFLFLLYFPPTYTQFDFHKRVTDISIFLSIFIFLFFIFLFNNCSCYVFSFPFFYFIGEKVQGIC